MSLPTTDMFVVSVCANPELPAVNSNVNISYRRPRALARSVCCGAKSSLGQIYLLVQMKVHI